VTYLGLEWVLNPIVRTDISVPVLLSSVGGDAYPERRDELIRILDIDTRWRMHAVSDGERRRVQLAMGLVTPWRVLLLDEITVDLDLLSRSRLLDWLKEESEERGCTIMYATHIFDHLAGWASNLVHLHMGKVKEWGKVEDFGNALRDDGAHGNSRLDGLVLRWLREDLKVRGPRDELSVVGNTYEYMERKGGYGSETRKYG